MERKQGCFTLMKRGAAAEDKAEQIKWCDAIDAGQLGRRTQRYSRVEACRRTAAGPTWRRCVATTHGRGVAGAGRGTARVVRWARAIGEETTERGSPRAAAIGYAPAQAAVASVAWAQTWAAKCDAEGSSGAGIAEEAAQRTRRKRCSCAEKQQSWVRAMLCNAQAALDGSASSGWCA
jgi:hypothetical protein